MTSAPRPRPDRLSQPLSGGGGGSSVPVQTYSARPYFSASDWYRCNSYLAYLWHEYRFLPVGNYLWRYAQGDSPLTDESLDYALRESSQAAGGLLASTEGLLAGIDRYESGRMSEQAFEELVKAQTKEIRDHAKRIRKDNFLDYLDQRQTKLKESYDRAGSVAQLRELATELRGLALEIDMGLRSFVQEDLTRTVDVNHLQRPSFDSLSKQVDKLAKVIEKSSREL